LIYHIVTGGIVHALARINQTMWAAEMLGKSFTIVPYSYTAVGRHFFQDIFKLEHPLAKEISETDLQQLSAFGLVEATGIHRDESKEGRYRLRNPSGSDSSKVSKIYSLAQLVQGKASAPLITAGEFGDSRPFESMKAPHWEKFMRPTAATAEYLAARARSFRGDLAFGAHFRGNDRASGLEAFLREIWKETAGEVNGKKPSFGAPTC
jgi:hypothetical protein